MYRFALGDEVAVSFRGTVVERKERLGVNSPEYVVKYHLPDGKEVFKRFAEPEVVAVAANDNVRRAIAA